MSKIYTKKGDKGLTSLLGKQGISKGDLVLESYGTIDELNCYIGLVADHIFQNDDNYTLLLEIQNNLFIIGANLAKSPDNKVIKLPLLPSKATHNLEERIDIMEKDLQPLKNFILPGGHPTLSFCHLARTVCRRAERLVVRLSQNQNIEPDFIIYLNRLSDYFFVLARFLAHQMNLPERLWKT